MGQKLLDISESVFPTKSSRVPLARLKCLTVGLLYRNILEACQRHASTFKGVKSFKPEVLKLPIHKKWTFSLLQFCLKPWQFFISLDVEKNRYHCFNRHIFLLMNPCSC